MPEMSGIAVSILVRNIKVYKKSKTLIIAFSASLVNEETDRQYEKVGIDDYSTKPYNQNKLIEKIHYWKNRQSKQEL